MHKNQRANLEVTLGGHDIGTILMNAEYPLDERIEIRDLLVKAESVPFPFIQAELKHIQNCFVFLESVIDSQRYVESCLELEGDPYEYGPKLAEKRRFTLRKADELLTTLKQHLTEPPRNDARMLQGFLEEMTASILRPIGVGA